ncbi:MAG: cyclic nucleotide-binding domain-containing protein [Ardenticatenaceae bacterium]|nr:cyclic nucleotide-binding domain-containing protein [Ardenticatenaceae bacterium]
MASTGTEFWAALEQAVDPATYKPQRRPSIVVSRLEHRDEPYYILKQPQIKSYLRLSEEDYALWWQMDGTHAIKDLLFYSLRRYHSLPIGRLNGLVTDLRQDHFLQDTPTNIYEQINEQLAARNPASRGRRLLNAFLHTEISVDGLDDAFTHLYNRLRGLFAVPVQLLLFLLIVVGSYLFGRLVLAQTFALSQNGVFSFASILIANLLVIGVHEMGHGLATKHFKRELNRGGFLLYWGMPAFFVDTRDIWLSPRWARVAVSWAGPHTGLLIGSAAGFALTFIGLYVPGADGSVWAGFIYQMGFLAFLSVVINLNPLLELDGYFILMDALELPNLRARAFDFWRKTVPAQWRERKRPFPPLHTLSRQERFFALFGGLALLYSAYALWLALYFWHTRLIPFVRNLWGAYGMWGQALVLVGTAVLLIPAVYYLLSYSWSRVRSALEWLARRDLLARADVLALLTGLPLLIGIPLLLLWLQTLSNSGLALQLMMWTLHLAAIVALIGVARQLPGSRFQWALWTLVAAPVGLTITWFFRGSWGEEVGVFVTAVSILGTGIIAGFTVWPHTLSWADRLLMAFTFLLGLGYTVLTYLLSSGQWLLSGLTLFAIFPGLIFMTPLIINFTRSRFALPWILLLFSILAIPWLKFYPTLHLPVIILWLYASVLYLLLGSLAQFTRQEETLAETGAFSERERLVNAFNHFMQAIFLSYEAIFGGRRLGEIQLQMVALGPIDPDATIFNIAQKIQQVLLLAVDRLDDLAGTPFTRQAGQAAYDSLPWLEAETLARHVLAELEWGTQLAQGFIVARDRRMQIVRQADIFAGFDQTDIDEVMQVIETREFREGALIARAQDDASHFFLVESGEVGVFHGGVQMASINIGGYFGTMALLDSGSYMATYRALSPVQTLAIHRKRFDPLLRADTTLAQQVNSGAQARQLLKKMPLFSSLSPQQLAAIDARLRRKTVTADTAIVRQGQPRSDLFIVAEGLVEVLVGDGATDIVVGELGPGEHFGEYALFADTPYQATYRAKQDSTLLLLDEARFDELVAGYADILHYVEQIGSGRLFATRRRLGLSAMLS